MTERIEIKIDENYVQVGLPSEHPYVSRLYFAQAGECVGRRIADAIRQQQADIDKLRAELADWRNLFAAVIRPSPIENPSLWPFDGGQDPGMVAFTIHNLRTALDSVNAELAEIKAAPVVACVIAHTDQGETWPAMDYEDENLPPAGTELIARPK